MSGALLLSLCFLSSACRSETREAAPQTAPAQVEAALPAAGLEVVYRGVPMQRAKRVVVLFHGYGADGNDLAGFAKAFDAGEQAAFVFPQAPIDLPNSGYAWFRRDGADFEEGFARARAFIRLVAQEAPDAKLVFGGFSQGAMLTANLIADAPPRSEAALIFSGADLLTHAPTADSRKLRVFISHGSADRILPYSQGESLRARFQMAGYDTTWVPFDGAHAIPREVVEAANTFLGSLSDSP